jgi:DNA mismatch repair protein MutS2
MRERDLIKLEFYNFLSRMKAYTHSEATEKYIDDIKPFIDPSAISRQITLVEDFMEVVDRISIYNFEDVEELVRRTTIKDYMLTVEEALKLLKVLKLIRELRRSLGDLSQNYKSLTLLTKTLYQFNFLENTIESLVDPRGFVKDSASDELRKIRQSIRDTEKEVLKRLETVFSRPDAEKVFSDRFVAYRNGRYVLPVKTSEVKKVIGVVHGTSSSGFTTYVEPQSVIELNNRLTTLREEEDEEIRRILRRLTSIIGEQHHRLVEAFRTLVRIDYLYAVCKLAKSYGGKFPKIGDHIELRGAKHPILLFIKEDVVPIDIRMVEKKGLVLTGPNTGGKTVALKTLGLCSLLFQCGIPIPIEEGILPFFERVFVDIGDEQSIEQSLSTFSSHISNVAEFLPHVDDKTLVLLDELGAGTDPVEGSALGIALLEYFKDKKSFVFVTTHHTPLKLYTLRSDYYTPASTLFDRESLKPLYKIVYNAVGESMALEVAKKLGVPEEVLHKAKENLPAGFEEYFSARKSLEAYIEDYQEKIRALEEERVKLNELVVQYEALKEELERNKREEISKVVQELKDRFEDFIREVQERVHSIKDKQRLKSLFEEKFAVYYQGVEEKIEQGDWVELLGSKGKVLELEGERAKVSFGKVKAWVRISELKKVEPPPQVEKSDTEKVLEFRGGNLKEINLTSLSVDEALAKLEPFIEEAYRLGLKTVKVIHGYGPLKRAVQDFLSSSKSVVFYREGYPREGGAGTTLVYLRRD